MRTVVLVPARTGSERVAKKNFREIRGESLLSRAARIGLSSGLATYVSTDDPDQALAHVPPAVSVVARPLELSGADTAMEEVVLHLVQELDLQPHDRVLLLQPTSPLRTPNSLRAFIQACESIDTEQTSAFSVTADLGDFWIKLSEGRIQRVRDRLPREFGARRSQMRQPLLRENGLYYLCSVAFLRRHRSLVGPSSVTVLSPVEEDLDIDSPSDWRRAEWLLDAGNSSDSPKWVSQIP